MEVDSVILEKDNDKISSVEYEYSRAPEYKSSVSSNEQGDTKTENNDVFIDTNYLSYFVSSDHIYLGLVGFSCGLFSNYGTLNLLGFILGYYYHFFINKANFKIITNNIVNFIPSFVFGVLIMQLSLFYFGLSTALGMVLNNYKMRIDTNIIPNMLNMLGNYRPLFERFVTIIRTNVFRTLYANINTDFKDSLDTSSKTNDSNTKDNTGTTSTAGKKNK